MRMKIQRSFSTYTALICLLLAASCSAPLYITQWQAKPVKVDGNATEWNKPLRYYDPTTKLQYTITNDLTNLYVCIRATSEESQQKMMRGGLQLWIDTAAKGKEKTGLLFPMPEIERAEQNPERPVLREEGSKKRFRSDRTEMEVTGFKAPIAGVLPLRNIYGVETNVNMDSLDILTYEALIPFKTFFKDSLGMADSARVFSIKIVLNGLPSKKKNHAADAASQMGSASQTLGASGRPGGGRGGGGRGAAGDHTPSNPLYETHTIKSKFRLRTVPTPVIVPRKWG
jgi:hypothetical protein